jgi:hypothetical protein
MGVLASEIKLKRGLNWRKSPRDFSLRLRSVSVSVCMASLMELMLLVTFFLEYDSFPLADFLPDLGASSFSTYLSSSAEVGLALRGLIIERKLFPLVFCCVGCAYLMMDLFFFGSYPKSIFLGVMCCLVPLLASLLDWYCVYLVLSSWALGKSSSTSRSTFFLV